MKTMVLNTDYQFIGYISWKRAIVLMVTDKIDVVEFSDKIVRSVSDVFIIPKVIRLINHVKKIYNQVIKFSKTNVFLRDKYICSYCGKKLQKAEATIDHILPKSKGGKDSWKNCVTSCSLCNSKKGNNTPEDSGMVSPKNIKIPTLNDIIQQKINFFY